MELILISNSKLKIMLDENDMRQYNIGGETDCAEPTTRRAIRSLLDCAREQIGFNTEGEEIFVQLYTSKKGGCELFITKCHLNDSLPKELTDDKKLSLPEKTTSSTKSKKQTKTSENKPSDSSLPSKQVAEGSQQSLINLPYRKMAFSFPSLNDLIAVCRALKKLHIHTESRACADSGGRFYLLLANTGLSAYSRLDKLTFINEYGERENPDIITSYINEHGKVICSENAIEALCDF